MGFYIQLSSDHWQTYRCYGAASIQRPKDFGTNAPELDTLDCALFKSESAVSRAGCLVQRPK